MNRTSLFKVLLMVSWDLVSRWVYFAVPMYTFRPDVSPTQILSEERVPTLLESLATNKLIPAPIASFKISRLSDQLNDGEITFGGLDATKFVANTLVTVPNVSKLGYWEAEMGAITVNGTSTGLSGHTAILDTGTTLILAPPSDAQKVVQGLGGSCTAELCTISCTTQASLALSFGNTSFSIASKDLAFLPLNLTHPTNNCSAGIQPKQVGNSTEWLVSVVFFPRLFGGRPMTKHSGRRRFLEERLLLYQRRNEPDFACEADSELICPLNAHPLGLFWSLTLFTLSSYAFGACTLNGRMQMTHYNLLYN